MMGRTHAATGLCAGLALAPAIGVTSTPSVALFAACTAGYALLPDLDCAGARASRLLGPVTGALSWAIRRASANLYRVTKGPRDEPGEGTHRHMSHTVLFALAVGGLTALAAATVGPWAVLAVVLFGLLLAQDALGDWMGFASIAAGLALVVAGDPVATLGQIGGWVGIAVAVGCITHCLGDAVTLSGCPFLFPVPIAGERWFEVRPPEPLRFRTGGWFEDAVVMPATMVGVVLLSPALGPWILDQIDNLSA